MDPEDENDGNFTEVNTDYTFYKPQASDNTIFYDDFEGGNLTSKNNWEISNVELSSFSEIRDFLEKVVDQQYKEWYQSLFDGKETKLASIYAVENGTSYMKLSNLNITEECLLTFRCFVPAGYKNTFSVYLNDDKKIFSMLSNQSGNAFNITTKSFLIPAGTNSITFELYNPNNWVETTWTKSAFIDDISLVKNKVSSLEVYPKSEQLTYIDCPENERIRAKVYLMRADGTTIDKAASLSSSNGNIDSNGFFTPTTSGSTCITVSSDGITKQSGNIIVYEDKLGLEQRPCTIAGVTYKGIISDNGNDLSLQTTTYTDYDGKIDFDYPKTDNVTADGFIRIKGKLTPSTLEFSDYTNVAIFVDGKEYSTNYFDNGDFDVRVWLPFGSEHTIYVYSSYTEYNVYEDKNGKLCEGDLIQCKWCTPYVINVKNIHQHTESDSGCDDGRFVYPSDISQSDNYLVQNVTNETLFNLPDNASDREKFLAIHDYIVLNYYYDSDSLEEGKRKKQDAVSVIKNGTCVCAGYSALTSAMARYAGIPSKYISSQELNHAWNHVRIDGVWYFCDTTWDDNSEEGSNYLGHNYFLLTDYNGVNNYKV